VVEVLGEHVAELVVEMEVEEVMEISELQENLERREDK
jgi:hypothetical protein